MELAIPGTIRRGRPKKTWHQQMKEDMTGVGVTQDVALDRKDSMSGEEGEDRPMVDRGKATKVIKVSNRMTRGTMYSRHTLLPYSGTASTVAYLVRHDVHGTATAIMTSQTGCDVVICARTVWGPTTRPSTLSYSHQTFSSQFSIPSPICQQSMIVFILRVPFGSLGL